MHVHYTFTSNSPKIKVHEWSYKGFSSIMRFWRSQKTFEVSEKPNSPGNKCKRQMGESLPSCQGPWGMLHQISRLYRQVWQFPMAMCSNRLGKVMWLSVVCPTYNTLGLMWSIWARGNDISEWNNPPYLRHKPVYHPLLTKHHVSLSERYGYLWIVSRDQCK